MIATLNGFTIAIIQDYLEACSLYLEAYTVCILYKKDHIFL